MNELHADDRVLCRTRMNHYNCPTSAGVEDVERRLSKNVQSINDEIKVIAIDGLVHGMIVYTEICNLEYNFGDNTPFISVEPRIENIREINRELRKIPCQIIKVQRGPNIRTNTDSGEDWTIPVWDVVVAYFIEESAIKSYWEEVGFLDDQIKWWLEDLSSVEDGFGVFLDDNQTPVRDVVSKICKENDMPVNTDIIESSSAKRNTLRWDANNKQMKSDDDPMFG